MMTEEEDPTVPAGHDGSTSTATTAALLGIDWNEGGSEHSTATAGCAHCSVLAITEDDDLEGDGLMDEGTSLGISTEVKRQFSRGCVSAC